MNPTAAISLGGSTGSEPECSARTTASSLVVGVAGATTDSATLLAAGVAGLVGGAISMALGEYVSVSSQRDSQRALIEKERGELADNPATELEELAGIYQAKGLSPATARLVAEELTAHDPLTSKRN